MASVKDDDRKRHRNLRPLRSTHIRTECFLQLSYLGERLLVSLAMCHVPASPSIIGDLLTTNVTLLPLYLVKKKYSRSRSSKSARGLTNSGKRHGFCQG